MSNKEILNLKIMGKNISIACPLKDKEGLIQAAEILNNQIESIPDKSNALILASLDLAFKSASSNSSIAMDSKMATNIKTAIQEIEKTLKN